VLRLIVLVASIGMVIGAALGRATSRKRQGSNDNTKVNPTHFTRRAGVLAAGDFRGLFFLLVSLLHGTLFFVLLGETLKAVESGSLYFWSATAVNFAVFFRVLQSQLAAALKYDMHWRLGPFDFIAVFVAVGLEYTLFVHSGYDWGDESFRLILIAIFGIFGALSYVGTFSKIQQGLTSQERLVEIATHGSNVLLMVACVFTALGALIWPHLLPVWAADIWITFCLVANIYVSMRVLLRARSSVASDR
jgi:hypothetical protein